MFPLVEIIKLTPEEFGRNARNTLFGIEICRDLQPGQSWIGVFAQEYFEFFNRWKYLVLGVLIPSVREKSQIMSHTIEWVTAYKYDGHNRLAYLGREAPSMQAGYPYLRKYTAEQIAAKMVAVENEAEEWVDNNIEAFRKAYAKR